MTDSPERLLDLCLGQVAARLPAAFEALEAGGACAAGVGGPSVCADLGERLLERLSASGRARDDTAAAFARDACALRRVRVRDAARLGPAGLRALLRGHRVRELECVDLRAASLGTLLDTLNSWSVENLTVLNVSKCAIFDSETKLKKLINLRSLNVSYTRLKQASFEILCEDLKRLEKLNISGTLVEDLKPLHRLSERLLSLELRDLALKKSDASYVTGSTRLQRLDLSLIHEKPPEEPDRDNLIKTILEEPDCLPDLRSLDISGWKNPCDKDVLFDFVDAHPNLEHLGLVANPLAFDPFFTEQTKICIVGLGTEAQIVRTLDLYPENPTFVQKGLYHLFQLTSVSGGARPEIIEKVLVGLERYPKKFGVQVAGTACLYNLTRTDLAKGVHPRLLRRGVGLILEAMGSFPEEYQLQKNSLLNLCNDRILQDVNFDKFKCAQLVLNALCAFDDPNMNRMAVAICSILAAKVTTAETSKLGARPVYMRKLLSMVQNRVELREADITMKYTLSALWNLTDESAATCCVFLEQGGAELFLRVLRTFKGDNMVETKVLGLLNNIAEVELIRGSLFIEDLIEELYNLLRSDHIDVSYFAAGIVAHLASDEPDRWTVECRKRTDALDELEAVIAGWRVPDCEMVTYRSFRPFFPLLRRGVDRRVQAWAVWAIYHVCNKNPTRYCKMLVDEKGVGLLNDLAYSMDSDCTVRKTIVRILDILKANSAFVACQYR